VTSSSRTLLLGTLVLALTAVAPHATRAQGAQTGPVSATRAGKGTPMVFPGTEDGIRAALDSLRTTGGLVSLDRGDYKITKSLIVWDGTTLMGAGEMTRLIAVGDPRSTLQMLKVGSNCRILNLALIGSGYPRDDWKAYGAHGIVGGTNGLGGMRGSRIEGCIFQGWNTIAINLAPSSNQNEVMNNRITDSGWEGIYLAQHCDSNLVQENTIDSCRRNAIDVCGSFNVIRRNHIANIGVDSTTLSVDTDGILTFALASVTGPVRGNLIEENDVRNAYNGISVLAGTDSQNLGAILRGNRIQRCRAAGMRLGSHPTNTPQLVRDIKIENNEIAECGSSGIFLESIPQYVVIERNHIDTNRGDGIRIVSARDQVRAITITKNTIISNARRGIFADPPACAHVKSDNVLEGNAEGPNGGASASAKSTR